MKKMTFIHSAKKITIACSILAASVSFGASAFAFSDLKGDPGESKINALHNAGIINGVTSDKFAPKSSVSFAQGIQFIVSGLKLSPKPSSGVSSDFFTNVNNKAWYASAFLTAKQNGLPIDKNVNPNAAMSRAQFAHLLAEALKTKGNFPVTLMYFDIKDGSKLPSEVVNNLQMLLNTRLIALDKNNNFHPNQAITRSEAAIWLHDTAEFAKGIEPPDKGTTAPEYTYETDLQVSKAGEGVNKVTLTVNNLPNPGYGLVIEKIEFGKDKKATIYFNVTTPDPSGFYPQVISKGSAVTYLPDGYTPVAKAVSGASVSGSSNK
ncbi:S-layer homology domain-containing protein [Paenibacillus sp. GCM10012306]|uniref:S-layer homology domain-containing protein n=1 Tax=Paenibacillus sp. GCM10012306 TaxID=3317342 RepID=UPI00362229E3